MSNNMPVVLVHGMFGFGPQELDQLNYWGSALQVPSPLPIIEASVGPISSPHDRACELAAQLKGTQVDYGETHAAAQGHERFGQLYNEALWPDWSEANPLHMVGHSLGASTIRALQNLLARDYWGWGSSEKWITSISSISGPLNGTTAVYYFGADPATGLFHRNGGIAPMLHLLELYTGLGDQTLDTIYDFDLDHWGYARQANESIIEYLQRIKRANFFWGPDNAFHSISLQSAYRDNARWLSFADTYYFSYVTNHTFRFRPGGYYYPSPLMNLVLQQPSWNLGRMVFKNPPIPDAEFRSSDWWRNDGLVPTYSQRYPHSNQRHPVGSLMNSKTPSTEFLPGHWYTQWENGFDHAAICIAPRFWQIKRQEEFYENLFKRLAELDLKKFNEQSTRR